MPKTTPEKFEHPQNEIVESKRQNETKLGEIFGFT